MRAFLRSPAALVLLVLVDAAVNFGWIFLGRGSDGGLPFLPVLATSAVTGTLVVLWVLNRRRPVPPANPFLADSQQGPGPR